jgi:hypothetical protein
MGTSVLPYLYRFNGVVDTNKPVLQNMETLTSAAGSWLTYDITQGKWAVIINKPGNVVASFNDSNIIGGIQFGSTSLTELYNAVKVTFPRDDLNDQRDFVRAEILAVDRNANEPDNDLNIDYDILNDPVQAEYLGLLELGQNRQDQTISFVTDYSMLGLKAGDIIDITSDQYGITDYLLRITNVTEQDDDAGGIQLQIIGVLYNADIYNPDLSRYERSNQNGLITLNGINQPGNITTTLYEKNSRPRILANTTVPGNVAIENVELWSSTDNVNFELVGNLPPPGGGTYSIGNVVSFDFDRAATGNVYLKSRAINSSASGPYSNIATIPYTPVQVTDAVGANTTLLDSAGNVLPTTLALSALLKLLSNTNDTKGFNDMVSSVTTVVNIPQANVVSKLAAQLGSLSDFSGYDPNTAGNRSNFISSSFSVPSGINAIQVDVRSPTLAINYTTLDQNNSSYTYSILAQPAMFVRVFQGSNISTATQVYESTIDWTSNYTKAIVNTPSSGTYWVAASIIPTYNLNLNWPAANRSNAGGNFSTCLSNEIFFDYFTTQVGADGSMDFVINLVK